MYNINVILMYNINLHILIIINILIIIVALPAEDMLSLFQLSKMEHSHCLIILCIPLKVVL